MLKVGRRSKSFFLGATIVTASPPHQVGAGAPEKVDTVSGSDASLKSKVDSVNKADDTDFSGGYADSEDTLDAPAAKGLKKGGAAAKNTPAGKGAPAKDTASGKKGVAATAAEEDYEYVVMIDAGSTGSRVHVYSFDTSVSPPKLINEEFQMLKPGLSSYDTDAIGAAESLDPLLTVAMDTIPKDKHSCSPVAVKATAGLRLLGEAKSDAILKAVRRHLEKDFPFPVVGDKGISIMDGSDEGVFAWITTNYLLSNIGSSKQLDTAAVFDLGGGSTQIVFEPVNGEKVLEGEHKYDIEFGGRKFTLYQYSHLGYGLMQARNKVNAAVLQAEMKAKAHKFVPLLESQLKTAVADITLENPCVPPGVSADNIIVELEDGKKYVVNFAAPAVEAQKDASLCKFLTDSILNKETECLSKSCSFNGIYQPSFADQFSSAADMYVFSYFYDRLQPIGMPESFTLKEMTDVMESVCAGSHLWDQYFTQKTHLKELADEPLWCLDLNFMTSLLHTGYDIPLTRELKTAKTIGGNELGWCLGASLPLLDKTNWTCKVTKQF
ncbi:guanosine diphosphatase [Pichia membranifaciens]|uniref:guanosine-diphosphatase n=1 Tax=Pichia membranifaciens TaxID=4926 RepID=A0A1Q2YI37_9ASCO|nr:guanosine diphosphatase [Pichia membranifaciens]